MPIQYPDVPQFQPPNLNLMGAYAQGAALQQQQLQEERLRQQMAIAEQSAAIAAERDARQAELAKAQLHGQQFDNLAKVRDQFNEDMIRAQNQEQSDKVFAKYIPIAGDILPQDRTFSEENKRRWITGVSEFMKATTPYEREYTNEKGQVVKGRFYTNPITNQEILVGGSELPQKKDYKEYGGEVYEQTPQGLKPVPILPAGSEGIPTSRMTANEPVFNNVPMTQIKQGFAKTESGSPEGNYAAIGPEVKRQNGVDRAYGKYQVMGENIPAWTKQALGVSMTPQEFLRSPEAQEKVFEDQFQRNFKKYGTVEDAASVWFSGRPLAQATKAGARDVNMGVPEYVQKVVGGMGPVRNVPTAPLTGVNPSLRALTEQPVNAMAPALPPINAMTAPSPQFNAAPAPTPMAQPLTVGTKKLAQGQANIDTTLDKLATGYKKLAGMKAMVSAERQTPYENIEAYAGATPIGQVFEGAVGTKAQKIRGELQSLVRSLITDIKNASGMSAQEMNSNVELQTMLKAMTDPTQDIDTVMNEIANLSERYGTGKHKGLRVEEPSVTGSVTSDNRPPLSAFYGGIGKK